MLKQAIFLSLCALLVSGCGSPYVLNIDTVPTGATIWQAGATSSYTTPVELAPDPNFRHPTTNCILVTQVHAKWQSGATVTSQDPIQLCGEFDTWTLTLKRPAGYPGLQIDLMVEQRILFERQLKADRGAAAMAAGFQSLGRGLGCLAAGGGCSSSDTSYSYSPQQQQPRSAMRSWSQQQQDQWYKSRGMDYSPVLKSKPNRCPSTSPYYLFRPQTDCVEIGKRGEPLVQARKGFAGGRFGSTASILCSVDLKPYPHGFSASILAREVYYRQFANRRQVASYIGLTPGTTGPPPSPRPRQRPRQRPPSTRPASQNDTQIPLISWRFIKH